MFSLVPRSFFNDDDDLLAINPFSHLVFPRSVVPRTNDWQRLLAEPKQLIRNGKFEVDFDMGSFDPETIKVKLDGRTLNVEAKHEKKSDGHYEYREFVRKITVPEEVAEDQLKCKIAENGRLHLVAPLKKPLEVEGGKGRNIPIEMVSNKEKK